MEKHELSKVLKKVIYVDDQDSKRNINASKIKTKSIKSRAVSPATIPRNLSPIQPPSQRKSYFLQKIALQEDVTEDNEKSLQSDQEEKFLDQQIDQDLSIVLEQVQPAMVPESPKIEELEIFKFLNSEFLD